MSVCWGAVISLLPFYISRNAAVDMVRLEYLNFVGQLIEIYSRNPFFSAAG